MQTYAQFLYVYLLLEYLCKGGAVSRCDKINHIRYTPFQRVSLQYQTIIIVFHTLRLQMHKNNNINNFNTYTYIKILKASKQTNSS